MNLQLVIWVLFLLLAVPLAMTAWTARQAAIELATIPNEEPKYVDESPLIREPDGSLTQTYVVQLPAHHSVTVTRFVGPWTLSANGRIWAANAVFLGLIVTLIGMVGLFYFPNANSSNSLQSSTLNAENE